MAKKFKVGDILGPHCLELLEIVGKTTDGKTLGRFLCPFHEDKHYFTAPITRVNTGKVFHCGCQPQTSKLLTGKKFGRLYVVKATNKRKHGSVVYLCKCSCDKHSLIEVSAQHLLNGNVQSCGCLLKEKRQENIKKATVAAAKVNTLNITGQKSGVWTALYSVRDSNNKIKWVCECENGHRKITDTTNFKRYKTCSECHSSLGENKVKDILEKLNISYIREYRFFDCRNKLPLPFDFYLPDYNCCIEYDGIQHFQETGYSHENLILRQNNDKIKTQYCLDNNIVLLRIPYTDYEKLNMEYLVAKLKEYEIVLEKKGE